MAAQTGKRYTCPKCGAEFIVTKGGDGDLTHLQRQLQLLGCLGRRPEPMSATARQLVPQLRDQNRLRLHFGQQKCDEHPQFRRVLR